MTEQEWDDAYTQGYIAHLRFAAEDQRKAWRRGYAAALRELAAGDDLMALAGALGFGERQAANRGSGPCAARGVRPRPFPGRVVRR